MVPGGSLSPAGLQSSQGNDVGGWPLLDLLSIGVCGREETCGERILSCRDDVFSR